MKVETGPGTGPLARVARDYEPTPPEIFEALMTEVRAPLERLAFVDWGAGKGRVLCLAAGLPFRVVTGIELFRPLAEVARENLAALPEGYVRAGRLDCATGDAGAWSPPAGPKVVFGFNPFGPQVLRRALAGLERERADGAGPPVYLLYYEPVHAALLDALPWLERRATSGHWAVWVSPEVAQLE